MQCHACGANISERAADCPHCGASVSDAPGGEQPSDDTVSTGSDSDGPTVPGASPGEGESDEADPGEGESDEADPSEAETTLVDTGDEETGWEAAGPPPEDRDADPLEQETTMHRESGTGDIESETSGQEPSVPGQESESGTGESSTGGRETATGAQEPTTGGQEPDTDSDDPSTGGQGPTVPGSQESADTGELDDEPPGGVAESETAVEAGGPSVGTGEQDASGEGDAADAASSEGIDPVAQVKGLPFLTAPLAGVVTGVVVSVLSVVVGVLVPGTGVGPVSMGGLVVMDLHFATSTHVTTGILTQFDTARPPNSVLGVLYLLPPLFLYTASKFVAAYNTDESTLTPMAGIGGSLVVVGYFPAMMVAFFLAPGGPFSPVSLLPAVLLAGIVYPVFFGFVGGLSGGAFSGSERRVSTLYGLVGSLIIAVGAFALTIPSIQGSNIGILPQIHASLYTVVSVNGFSLGGANVGLLVLLAYPFVALVLFATGFLRAWNAEDVAGPLRGLGKGLNPAVTYFTLLGLLGTVLPLLADPWVVQELGFSFAEASLVQGSIQREFYDIGRYVTVVFVGTLVYAVFLGGLGGTIAGTARYFLSDSE